MRIHLKGDEGPNPELAFPDPGDTSDAAVLVLSLPNGVPFIPQTYIDLGYTHYEVWCVGGAGGTGGEPSDMVEPDYVHSIAWRQSSEILTAPDEVWDAWIDIMIYYGSLLQPPYGPYSPQSPAGVRAHYEHPSQPNRFKLVQTTYYEAYQNPFGYPVGGAGGGGGVHRASGLLAALPDEVPVVVGQAGAKGALGQVAVNGLYTPELTTDPIGGPYPPTVQAAMETVNEWSMILPEEYQSFDNPKPGQDGGASSFNGETCKASGGKGGRPGKSWISGSFQRDGKGGDGGVGNRTTAGGGGAGSSSGLNGVDGDWNPVTGIGKGGGGGRGGTYNPGSGPTPGIYIPPSTTPGTDGGRGAFSYVDPQVYGARQQKSVHAYTVQTYNLEDGTPSEPYVATSPGEMEPGGGGGARANRQLHYGGKGPGANPNGVVLIRLTRID